MMVFSCCLLLLVASSAWASDPIVRSPTGTFLGCTLTAWSGQVYNAFRGIPYAKPPVKDLRFQPPVAIDHIDGVYEATHFKPHCVQINILPNAFDLGQEDCLYLNVFTPRCSDRNDGDLKKVFVFVHGGANLNGFPHIYLPGTLVTEQDVIVVTVAYRLGYLGLLSTLTPSCEGNLHLKDQLLSLAWVQENILDFGGDPAAVTIGGESAGAFDTSLLALVPQSRDLFARAYCQSGATGTKNTALITNPRPEAIKLIRKLGCLRDEQPDPVADSEFEKLVGCLKQLPAELFAMNGTTDIPNLQSVLSHDLFPKSVEELFSDEKYLKSINFFDRNYLVGLNENEGATFEIINKHFLSALPEEVARSVTPQVMFYKTIEMFVTPVFGPVSQDVIQEIAEYYENNYQINPLADFTSDAIFHISTLQYVTAAAAGRSSQDSGVYLFQFLHSPEYFLDDYEGLLHGMDILYLFDLDIDTVIKIIPLKVDTSKWTKDDDLLRQKFIRLVGDFINTGFVIVLFTVFTILCWSAENYILGDMTVGMILSSLIALPHPKPLAQCGVTGLVSAAQHSTLTENRNPGQSLNSELPSSWPGFDQEQQQYLEFGLNLKVKNHLIRERVQLWSEQIPKWIQDYPLLKSNSDK